MSVEALLAFWQPVLRVADWHVLVQLDAKLEAYGVCQPDYTYKRALITLRDPAAPLPGYDLEETLVHELVHLHFAAFDTQGGSPERTAEEQAVESLMRALIQLKRSGAPVEELRSLARTGIAGARARARQITPAPRAGRRKRMDIKMFLAALKAALTAEDPKAAIEALVQEVEGMAGGEELPASEGDPPMAGEGGDDKPPMAGEGEGGDDKPPYQRKPGTARAPARQAPTGDDRLQAGLKQLDETRRDLLLDKEGHRLSEGQLRWAKTQSYQTVKGLLDASPEDKPAGGLKPRQRATQGDGAGKPEPTGEDREAASEVDRALGMRPPPPDKVTFGAPERGVRKLSAMSPTLARARAAQKGA